MKISFRKKIYVLDYVVAIIKWFEFHTKMNENPIINESEFVIEGMR